MCHLVTLGIDKSLGSALPAFGTARESLAVDPSRNPSVGRLFPPGDLLLEITVGGCSCGLFPTPAKADHDEGERRRYEKKGWSAAKIERALQSSRAARGRDRESENARRFREGIVALLRRTSSVRLFAHMYRGAFDSEAVSSLSSIRMTVDEYQRQHGALPEDVLVEIAG
jgi:hypothetical protein